MHVILPILLVWSVGSHAPTTARGQTTAPAQATAAARFDRVAPSRHTPTCGRATPPTPTARQFTLATATPNERIRTLRWRYEVANTTGKRSEPATFEAFVPTATGPHHRLLSLRANQPATLREEGANRALAVTVPPIPPHGRLVLTLTAQVGVRAEPKSQRRPGTWALNPAPLIESDTPGIVKQAAALRRGTPADTARAIYDWIWKRTEQAGFTARDQGARHAFETRRGDCSEMAYLFVALSRAAGLPARYVGGWMAPSSAVLAAEGYHNWAEWYDGRSWRIADPQQRIFDERPERFIATTVDGPQKRTLLLGAHRFRIDARGLDVRMLGGR